MLVELDPHGPLERRQGLAEFRFHLRNLQLDLEQLSPGAGGPV